MSSRSRVCALLVAAACGAPATREPAPAAPADSAIARDELRVDSAPGVSIAVRSLVAPGMRGEPVLLVHGAGGGGIASFDLPVPGYSLAEDLARAGHPTYVIDIRGWGRSSRPAALAAAPDQNAPAVGSDEAVADIAAAATAIRARHRGARIAVVGWATGGHWAGMYASRHPDAVAHLAMINGMYGVAGAWSLQRALEDPERPGQFPARGAYSLRTAQSLVGRWESTIPGDDKAAWRDPRVRDAYIAATMAGDPTSVERDPPTVRVPTGPLRDSFLLAAGTKLWSAEPIRAAVLIVRSALDFWSRPEDVAALRADLRGAARVQVVEIANATHFVHLDRPERGRAELVTALLAFLAS